MAKTKEHVEPTAGPWYQNNLVVTDAAGDTICHCTRWAKGQRPMPHEAEANAELITQTPAMRDAIKDFLEWGAMTGSDRDIFIHRFRTILLAAGTTLKNPGDVQ